MGRWEHIDEEEDDQPQPTEAEDEPVAIGGKTLTLTAIRNHVRQHAWNGRDFTARDSNYDVFRGMCEYASTAISEILTGTGLNFGGGDWSLRVRGWYRGDLSESKTRSGCDDHAFTEGKHCHSWVEYGGKIIDPTYWQFAGGPVRVYVFELDDPRYIRDPDAEGD